MEHNHQDPDNKNIIHEIEKPPWANIYFLTGIQYSPIFTLKSLQSFPCIRQYYLEFLRKKIAHYEVSQLYQNDNWEYYKKLVNPYELVYTQCKYSIFPPSICILKPLSRSYFKMVEILEVFQFFDELRSEFVQTGMRTAHACEGPGGFIEAVWDIAEKYKIRVSSSTAITLRSNHTNIPGWRRATNFLSKHKQIKILYGEDKTGDILKKNNQEDFIQKVVGGAGKVHLFTADGGLDFSDNYENQEAQIFPILLASAKIGIGCLKRGGMMILKFFDIQNNNTKQLLFLIQQCFSRWTLYKPAMSRPCNPEQYFIGMGYKYGQGGEIELIEQIDKFQLSPPGICILYPNGLPSEFLNNLELFQNILIEFQIKYLDIIFKTIKIIHQEYLYSGNTDGKNEEIKKLLRRNEKISYDWCVRFRMPHRLLSS